MFVKLLIGFFLFWKIFFFCKVFLFLNNNKNVVMFVYLFLFYDKYFIFMKNILDLREGRGCCKVMMDFIFKNFVRIFVKFDKIVCFFL